jgi:hypothetical protein
MPADIIHLQDHRLFRIRRGEPEEGVTEFVDRCLTRVAALLTELEAITGNPARLPEEREEDPQPEVDRGALDRLYRDDL